MNVTSFYAVDYGNKSNWTLGENKANSKPNKANLTDDQMNVNNVNKVLTKDYENTSNWTLGENKANTNPTCRGVASSGEAGTKPISPPPAGILWGRTSMERKIYGGSRCWAISAVPIA